MNYIIEINRFYEWLETNNMSKCAISLWHALMHINNKASGSEAWIDRFTVWIKTLENKTGFKPSEIYDARAMLTEKKRILWNSRGGNQCAEYSIISFYEKAHNKRVCLHIAETSAETSVETSAETNGVTNPGQTPPINKPNETKQIKANAFTEEEISSFNNFQAWIKVNAPRVNKMKRPFTIHQYLEIGNKYNGAFIKELLQDMDNYEPLTKNVDACKTFLKWAKKREEEYKIIAQASKMKFVP